MSSLSLLADGGRPSGSPFSQPDLLIGMVMLVGALLVGAAAVYAMDKWRKRSLVPDDNEAGADLTGFRAMYERGELSEEEYARLRQKVEARAKAPPAKASVGESRTKPPSTGVDAPAGTPPPPESPPPA